MLSRMISHLSVGRILSKPFQLHSQTTAIMLFLFALLIGSKHLFGTSVNCSTERNLIQGPDSKAILTELCTDLLYTEEPSGERKSQGYYQFVYVVLFAQAIACLIPALIWKTLENNRQDQLVQGLRERIYEKVYERDEFDVRVAAKYLKANQLGRFYLVNYVFCLLLCLANLIGQIIFINWFLGGDSEFSYFFYGFHKIFTENSQLAPRASLFPSTAHCKSSRQPHLPFQVSSYILQDYCRVHALYIIVHSCS